MAKNNKQKEKKYIGKSRIIRKKEGKVVIECLRMKYVGWIWGMRGRERRRTSWL